MKRASMGSSGIIAWVLVGLAPVAAAAEAYHIDPSVGAADHEGSPHSPWRTLEEVVDSGRAFEAGDVIYLHGGHHGRAVIQGRNEGSVTIRAAEGEEPVLAEVTFREARNWELRGVTVRPAWDGEDPRTLVRIGQDSTRITVRHCTLFSVADASGWSATDWDERARSGIAVRGSRCQVIGNTLRNVNFGITASGPHNRVAENTIANFCGDGMRGLGDYSVFEYNLVKNCFDVNDNHDDGFQSWSRGEDGVGSGVVRGLVLRGNRILNFEDPSQPLRGRLQGIGCFDGFFEEWVVENNLILVDHWHGITLMGARDCRAVNNTVADLNGERPGPPWLRIADHKDGRASEGNVVRNNLATAYAHEGNIGTMDHNREIEELDRWFRDPSACDFRLRSGSPAIDAGSKKKAPVRDLLGEPRPQDGDGDGTAAWDLGAYELDPVESP